MDLFYPTLEDVRVNVNVCVRVRVACVRTDRLNQNDYVLAQAISKTKVGLCL